MQVILERKILPHNLPFMSFPMITVPVSFFHRQTWLKKGVLHLKIPTLLPPGSYFPPPPTTKVAGGDLLFSPEEGRKKSVLVRGKRRKIPINFSFPFPVLPSRPLPFHWISVLKHENFCFATAEKYSLANRREISPCNVLQKDYTILICIFTYTIWNDSVTFLRPPTNPYVRTAPWVYKRCACVCAW